MDSEPDDSKYKCTLDSAHLQKAKKELGENPETRMLEVKTLRKRLAKVTGLKPRKDAAFLISFLRARKFDQERAFKLVKRHYEEKRDNPKHYEDIKPSVIKHTMGDDMFEVLRHRDKQGCRIVIVRPGRWQCDRYPGSDCVKLLFLILSKLIEEEETQVNGIHMIDLLDTVTLKHASHMSPALAKLITASLQDMLPLRLKHYDIVKEPTFFDVVFTIFKSFMKDKLVQRFKLHGNNVEGLHATIDPEHLPTDLGGKQEPFSYNKEFMPMLLAAEKDFEDSNKFGYVSMSLKNEKKESSKEDAGLQGLGGTFKKLDI